MNMKTGIFFWCVMLLLVPTCSYAQSVLIAPPFYSADAVTGKYDSYNTPEAAVQGALAKYFEKNPSFSVCAGRYTTEYLPPNMNIDGYIDVATSNYQPSGDQGIDLTCQGIAFQAGVLPSKTNTPRSPGAPCCDGGVSVGNPISVGEKLKYQIENDYEYGDLSLDRYYSSNDAVQSTHMGAHWRNSYDLRISIFNESDNQNMAYAVVYREDGKQLTFERQGGVWSGPGDISDSLSEADDPTTGLVAGFVFRTQNRVEYYTSDGVLRTIKWPTGRGVNLSYSDTSTPAAQAPAPGLLLSVTDFEGRSLTFNYNGNSTVSGVVLPDGGVISYSYDANMNLTAVKHEDGSIRTYLYNEASQIAGGAALPNALTGIVDESGARYSYYGYDAEGNAVSTSLAGGSNQYNVDYLNNRVYYPPVQDGERPSATYIFSAINGVHKLSSAQNPNYGNRRCTECSKFASVQYNGNGNLQQATDFDGNITNYSIGSDGLERSRTEATGKPAQRTTETTWDTTLLKPLVRTVTDANGTVVAKTAWVYNTAGDILARCHIDPVKAPTYTCSATGAAPSGVRRWTYTYCSAVDTTQCPLVGLLLSVTGPRADLTQTTTYSYYLDSGVVNCGTPGSNCHQPGDLHTITDALGHVITIASYDADGRITRQTDPNGVITDLTYTPRGWLASRSVGGDTTHLIYWPYGNIKTVTDSDGIATTYTYDAAHRLTDITDAQDNRIHYTLDAAGNRIAEQVFDSGGTVHQSLARSYNALGQLTGITDGLNITVFNAAYDDSYDANGNLVDSTDGLGYERWRSYDALNRLIKTIDNYNGTEQATANTTTQFAHDSLDRLTQVTDPGNLATTYSYDGLGDATGQISPDTGGTSRSFDAAGNVLTHTDAKGITATSTYDALDRLTTTTYPDSTQNVAYHYDEANSVTGCSSSYPLGHLTRIVETAVTTVYCYDAQGRVIEKQQITGTTTDTTGYAYTNAGRLSGMVYPSGTMVTYTRDTDGRIQSLSVTPPTGTTSTAVSSVTYQPFGPVSGYTLGNGQAVTRSYDANYRLTDLTSPAFSLHAARDAMGDITAIGNAPNANPATETYRYDRLYRLTQVTEANGSTLESVTYNQTGDRLSKTGSGLDTGSYSYNPNTHQLVATGSYTRAVDANGNTTAITAASGDLGFGYDDRNRLIVAQLAGGTVGSYTYNALGERISKIAGTTSERYGYDEDQRLLSEQGATNRDYVWMDGTPVANVDISVSQSDPTTCFSCLPVGGSPIKKPTLPTTPVASTQGVATSTLNYVIADGLDTPRVVSDGSGATIWQWAYQGNPFGEQQPTSTTGYVLNLRFPGQYYDIESGLNYNVNRYYESAIGGYDQPDPMGLAAGPSLYAYINSDPLGATDPLGLQSTVLCANPANAAACAAAGIGAGQSGVSTGTVVAVGAGLLTAVGADTALRKQCDDDDQCGPDSRFEAYTKALEWAGMGIGDEGVPIPWSQYRGRGGANYTYVRQNGGSNYGYYDPASKAKVMNHPDGHLDQLGDGHPEHHNCPHFHAVNARGEERIFPYKRGT